MVQARILMLAVNRALGEKRKCGRYLRQASGFDSPLIQKTNPKTMTTRNLFGNLLGAATFGGLIIAAPALSAQEGQPHPQNPPPGVERGEAERGQDLQRIRQMFREMEELKRAGKPDAAGEMAGKIRRIAGENPRVIEELKRNIEEAPKPEANRGRRPDKAPEGPMQEARMKMQKLRQAAELLQSAGYGEQAVKAREEVGRIEERVRREESAAKGPKPEKPQMAEKPHQEKSARKVDKPHKAKKAEKPHKADKAKKAHKGHNSKKADKHHQRDKAHKADSHRKAGKPGAMRPGDGRPMMEEIRKLRRDLDELRGELRRSKANNGPKPMPGRPQPMRPMDAR